MTSAKKNKLCGVYKSFQIFPWFVSRLHTLLTLMAEKSMRMVATYVLTLTPRVRI